MKNREERGERRGEYGEAIYHVFKLSSFESFEKRHGIIGFLLYFFKGSLPTMWVKTDLSTANWTSRFFPFRIL